MPVSPKIEYTEDDYDEDECRPIENFNIEINCGICGTPVTTNTIDRNYYCLEGCPMEKIIQKEKEEHKRHVQWIKENKDIKVGPELELDDIVNKIDKLATITMSRSPQYQHIKGLGMIQKWIFFH